ncbi:MAG: HD domain-containing protein [Clostridia bacterium]|nr:HD domain-containing protein [Clostridia bacterium]
MRIEIPKKLQALARVFKDAGVPAYAVGGLVRNALLGLPGTDADICSRLRPEALRRVMEAAGYACADQGARFGTLAILLEDGERVEHTSFRADDYAPGGAHRPRSVRFSDSLEEDAFRRDFTVNALYAALDTGELLDPTGGLEDLACGRLRATGESPAAIMGSDALRVLRLVRFAGELGFSVEPATWAAAKANAGGLLEISVERIRGELDKILLSDARYGRGALLDTLMRLEELRAFERFWPELAAGRGMAQRPEAHRYTVLEHGLRVCAAMPPVLALRLAGLLHDVGKPESLRRTGNFHAHAGIGAAMAGELLRRLRYERALTMRTAALIERHMYDIQGTAKDATLKKAFVRWGRAGTEDMICMREADVRGCGYDEGYVQRRWRALYGEMQAKGTPFSAAELAVDGRDALNAGLPPGPAVGAALEALLAHCALRPGDNTRERLLKLLVNIRPQK